MIQDFYIVHGETIFVGGLFLAIITSFFEVFQEIRRGSKSKLKISIRFASPLFVYLIFAGALFFAAKKSMT